MELVERTLKVLLALSGAENGLSVSELSLQLELPPSSTHRILASLKKNGFALQDETTKRYRIGYRVLTLCQNIKQNNSLIATSHPFMKKLSEQLNKTVTLCVMEGDQIVCIDYIENKDTSMFYVRTGFAMPPYATSAGKVIQAYMNRKKVEKLACTGNGTDHAVYENRFFQLSRGTGNHPEAGVCHLRRGIAARHSRGCMPRL